MPDEFPLLSAVRPTATTHVTKILPSARPSRASRGLIVRDATNQQIAVVHSFRIHKTGFSHEQQ
ncbi:MAG TPA: hypothetical protein VLB68_00480 [Pyrinomonadaceae bacterium]|nr:hypothetical protein [Pyrinomonadaceae bacterium]